MKETFVATWLRVTLPWRRGKLHWVAALALFVVLTLLMTWPMLLHLEDSMMGPPATDNFDYLYEVWWLKYAIFERNISPLLNSDIFYPFGYPMFAARHHSIANTILSVPLSLVGNEVVGYNCLLLFSFVCSAFGAYLLVFYWTRSWIAGLISGIIFAFCPYRMFCLHIGHLPQIQTQWFPFLFLYVEKTIQKSRPKTAFMSGLFYALTVLSSLYYAPMSLVLVVSYVLMRAKPWREYLARRDVWISILIFLATVLTIAGPMLWVTIRLYTSHEIAPIPIQGAWISASVLDFFVPNFFHPLWGKYLLPYYARNSHENYVSLGTIPLMLMVIGLWRGRSRFLFVYAVLFVSSFVLALGPVLQLWGKTLYFAVPSLVEKIFTVIMTLMAKHLAVNPTSFYWRLWVKDAVYVPLPAMLLYLFVPFFHLANYPSRFGIFTTLTMAVLAGVGVSRLLMFLCHRGRAHQETVTKLSITTLILAAILFEFAATPPPYGMAMVVPQPVDQWLATQEGDFAVMKYPIWKALQGTAHYSTIVHGKKIVYGYGSFIPRTFADQLDILSRFPNPECIDLLRQWKVRYVLVYSDCYGEAWKELQEKLATNRDLNCVHVIQEEPIWVGDRLLQYLPEYNAWFVISKIYIYEISDVDL